jgi:hypothetical protein
MAEQTNDGNKRQRRLIIIAVIVFGILLVRHMSRPRAQCPPELIGTWRTTSAQYAERSLEVDSISINFGTGPGTVSTWFVETIHTARDHGGTLYTISYVANDLHEQASIIYQEAGGDETIRFANHRDIVWHKVDVN